MKEQALKPFLHQLFENANDGILQTSADGRYLRVNRKFSDLVGMPAEAIVGRSIDLFAPVGFAPTAERLQHILREGRLGPYDLEIKTPLGIKHISVNAFALRDDEQRPVGIISIVRDGTEDRRDRDALRESQARLAEAEQLANMGSWVWDLVGGQTSWSDQLYRIYGLAPADFSPSYESFLARVHPDDRQAMEASLERMLASATHEALSFRIVRPDGSVRRIEGWGVAMRDENGRVLRVVGTNQDVTDEIVAEERAREAETRFRNLVDSLPVGVMRSRVDGTILSMNPAGMRMLGYTELGELLATNTKQLYLDPADRAKVLERYAKEGPTIDYEIRARRQDGSVFWARTNGRAVLDREGRVAELESVWEDVTERKDAEQALRASEERFRSLADGAPVGIFHTDAAGHGIYANPRWYEITGLTPEQGLRDGWLTAVHPEDRDRVRDAWELSTRAGAAFECEFRFVRPTGEVRRVMANASPVRSLDRTVVGYVGTNLDITARWQAEQGARQAETRFRQLVESLPMGVFETTPDGTLLSANPAGLRIYGYADAEELRTKSTRSIWVDPAERQRILERYSPENPVQSWQAPHQRKDGSVIWIQGRARAIFDEGRIVRLETVLEDITEKKAMEQTRSDFLAMLTHDLKNPITTLLGFSELLEHSERADRPDILHGMQSAATRALTIANNFLDYTQIESGSLELRREGVQVNVIVGEVVDSQRGTATVRGISIETDFGADLPWLMLDESLFGRAVANLVGNAIKFSPDDSRISIETAGRGDRVLVSVRDQGPGIAPADRGKLFQRFGVLSKRGKGSTGLGLFIVKTVVEAHGGEVAVECPPEGGSIFQIFLPARVA